MNNLPRIRRAWALLDWWSACDGRIPDMFALRYRDMCEKSGCGWVTGAAVMLAGWAVMRARHARRHAAGIW